MTITDCRIKYRKIKEVCWICGLRKVTQYTQLGLGVCTHCAVEAQNKARKA